MGPPVLRRMHAASDIGVAESGVKSLVSPLLADTCRGGHGEADFISSNSYTNSLLFLWTRSTISSFSSPC